MSTPDGITVRPSAVGGTRPAVIVLPGGGYEEHGRASSGPMADWFAGIGLHAFLFRYPIRPSGQGSPGAPDVRAPLHPAPIEATRRVFDWVRAGAPGSGVAVDTERIGVVGSSAGGHLAASLANGIDDSTLDRPAFCVLAYPVISMETPTRPRPLLGLLGEDAPWRTRRELSMETRVDARTPPTFVWTTADDRIVRATDTLTYADALVRNEVDVEVHVFPHGRHGLGTAVREPHTAQWTRLCGAWLRYRGVLGD